MLNTYTSRTQTILHDFNGTLYGSPLNLTNIINQARARVALQGQCVRVIPASSSAVSGSSITSGGSGYTTCTAAISGPDMPNGVQATATVTLSGGAVTGLTISGGSGYVNAPTVTFTGNGTGAAATLTLNPINATVLAQELYTFSALNALAANVSGVASIQSILSVAVSQGNVKPMLRYMSFVQFQAFCRVLSGTEQNYPSIWSQYGQGASGSIYLFPVPSGTYSMDWDCCCLPINLATDSDPEAIPYPWTEAVPYYAAKLCYEYSQRPDDAAKMLSEYNRYMLEARAFSMPPQVPDVYEEDD